MEYFYRNRVANKNPLSDFDKAVLEVKIATERTKLAKKITDQTGICVSERLIAIHTNALIYGDVKIAPPRSKFDPLTIYLK